MYISGWWPSKRPMAARPFTKQFGREPKEKWTLLPCVTIKTRAKVTAKDYIFGGACCQKQGKIVVFILRRGLKNILHIACYKLD